MAVIDAAPPDIEAAAGGSGRARTYISLQELMEDLKLQKMLGHPGPNLMNVKDYAVDLVICALASRQFFQDKKSNGIEAPFMFQPAKDSTDRWDNIYIHETTARRLFEPSQPRPDLPPESAKFMMEQHQSYFKCLEEHLAILTPFRSAELREQGAQEIKTAQPYTQGNERVRIIVNHAFPEPVAAPKSAPHSGDHGQFRIFRQPPGGPDVP